MQKVIDKYKAWKEGHDEDYHCDEIHDFISDLSRGELYSFFEWAAIVSDLAVPIQSIMLKEEKQQ